MRKLLPVLLILTGCAMRAQQSFPGINITPNSGSAGKVQFRTSANVNSMFLQNRTVDGNGDGISFSATGTSVADPAFTFTDGSGYIASLYSGALGGWSFTSASFQSHAAGAFPGQSNFIVTNATGQFGTSSGLVFYESAGLSGDNIQIRAPSGGVTSSYTINFPGTAPSVAGQALAWSSGSTYTWQAFMTNPMTTTGDIIIGGASGVPTRLAAGTNGYWLQMQSGSPAWAQIDPAWTSYSPTVACTSGSVTTGGLTAAYIQTGKTVKVRIYWTGSCSSISTGITFTTPVNPGVTYQTIAGSYTNGADFLGLGNIVFGAGVNLIGAQPTGVGGQFPASTTVGLYLEGVYESS